MVGLTEKDYEYMLKDLKVKTEMMNKQVKQWQKKKQKTKKRNGNYRKNEKENLEIKKYNNGNERFAR